MSFRIAQRRAEKDGARAQAAGGPGREAEGGEATSWGQIQLQKGDHICHAFRVRVGLVMSRPFRALPYIASPAMPRHALYGGCGPGAASA